MQVDQSLEAQIGQKRAIRDERALEFRNAKAEVERLEAIGASGDPATEVNPELVAAQRRYDVAKNALWSAELEHQRLLTVQKVGWQGLQSLAALQSPDMATNRPRIGKREQATIRRHVQKEVAAVRDQAIEERTAILVRVQEVQRELHDAVLQMGRLKAKLMLMDQDLVANGFEATGAHEDIQFDRLSFFGVPSIHRQFFLMYTDAVRNAQ
jgi:hypothetical protein